MIDKHVKSRENEYCGDSSRNSSRRSESVKGMQGRYSSSKSNSSRRSESVKGMQGRYSSSKSKPVYSVSQNAKRVCSMCQGEHYFNQCPEFIQLPVDSRNDIILQKRLCRNCLHTGHIASKDYVSK